MCVKNNVDIVDKSCTKISQTGEPLEINVDIVDNTISPKSKVNQASRTSISTICVRKRTQTLQTNNFTKLQFQLYVCQKQRRHCRQHHFTKIQSESSKWNFNFDYMCSKTDVDIVDKQLHQTSISTICVSKTTQTLYTNPAPKYLKLVNLWKST